MILNHDQILQAIQEGRIGVDPFDPAKTGPNSYDVHLHDRLLMYDLDRSRYIVPHEENPTKEWHLSPEGSVLHPGQFVLGATLETVTNHADDLVPMLEGRSSLARLGLSVHETAGFGDIGFYGRWTLEISAKVPILLKPGMPIAQLYWLTTAPSVVRYRGKYNGESGPAASRLFREQAAPPPPPPAHTLPDCGVKRGY